MSNKNICKIIPIAIAALMLSCNNNSVTSESANQNATTDTNTATAIATATATATATTTPDTTDQKALPDNEKSIVQILQTGKFNPDEVDKSVVDKKWIGLFKIGSMYFLRSTSLEVFPTTDTNANVVRKVLMVNTLLLNRCVILISGLENINEKNLVTARHPKDSIFPNDRISISLKKNSYALSAEGVMQKNDDGGFQIISYKLFLTGNINGIEIKQLLVAQPLLKNEMVSILWTGDMDGDSKLDLVINASPTKGYSTPALYLSSKATENELVKFVGQHVAK